MKLYRGKKTTPLSSMLALLTATLIVATGFGWTAAASDDPSVPFTCAPHPLGELLPAYEGMLLCTGETTAGFDFAAAEHQDFTGLDLQAATIVGHDGPYAIANWGPQRISVNEESVVGIAGTGDRFAIGADAPGPGHLWNEGILFAAGEQEPGGRAAAVFLGRSSGGQSVTNTSGAYMTAKADGADGQAAAVIAQGSDHNIQNDGFISVEVQDGRARGFLIDLDERPDQEILVHQPQDGGGIGPMLFARADRGYAAGLEAVLRGEGAKLSIQNGGYVFALSGNGTSRGFDVFAAGTSPNLFVRNEGLVNVGGRDAAGIVVGIDDEHAPAGLTPRKVDNVGTIHVGGFDGDWDGILDDPEGPTGLPAETATGIDVSAHHAAVWSSGSIVAHALDAFGVRVTGDDNDVQTSGSITALACGNIGAEGIYDYGCLDGKAPAISLGNSWAFGLSVDGNRNVVTTSGTVLAEASPFPSMDDLVFSGIATAIVLNGSHNELHLNNPGSVAATAFGDEGAAFGLFASGSGFDVVSDGDIQAAAPGVFGSAYGIVLQGSGEVTNRGFLNARASGDGGRAFGITVEGQDGPILLTNESLLSAGADGTAAALWLQGSIAAKDALADVTVRNRGHIGVSNYGDKDRAFGVLIGPDKDGDTEAPARDSGDPPGTFTIVNEKDGVIGDLSGDGAASIGVLVPDYAYEFLHIENRGELVGDVILGGGQSRVELHAGSETKGAVIGGNGLGTVEVRIGAALDGVIDGRRGFLMVELNADADAAGIGDMRGKLKDVDAVLLFGGDWQLDSDALGGAVTAVGAGSRLVVGSFTLQDAGHLGGRGTVVGDVVNTGGIVSPGASIGQLTIEGSYTHQKDAALMIEFDLRETDPEKRSDRLVIVAPPAPGGPEDGKAIIKGGDLYAIPLHDTLIQKPEETVVLTAEKGVDGRFNRVIPVGIQSFVQYDLRYDGTDDAQPDKELVVLTVSPAPFGGAASRANDKAVAAALDRLIGDVDPEDPNQAETRALLIRFQYELPVGRAPQAFAALGGEVYALHAEAALRRLERLTNYVDAGINSTFFGDGDRQAWASTFAGSAQLTGDQDYAEGHGTEKGIFVGMPVVDHSRGAFGLFAGGGQARLSAPAPASQTRTDTTVVGAYADWESDAVSLRGVVAYGWDRHESVRHLLVRFAEGPWERTAAAAWGGSSLSASGAAAFYGFSVGSAAVYPSVRIAWVRTGEEAVQERGAGPFSLTVAQSTRSRLSADAGAAVAWPRFQLGTRWSVLPAMWVHWQHNFTPEPGGASLGFAGHGADGFAVGTAAPVDGFRLSAALAATDTRSEAVSWTVGYDGDWRPSGGVHSLHLGVSVRF